MGPYITLHDRSHAYVHPFEIVFKLVIGVIPSKSSSSSTASPRASCASRYASATVGPEARVNGSRWSRGVYSRRPYLASWRARAPGGHYRVAAAGCRGSCVVQPARASESWDPVSAAWDDAPDPWERGCGPAAAFFPPAS